MIFISDPGQLKFKNYIDKILDKNDFIAFDIILNYSLWLSDLSYSKHKTHESKINAFFLRVIRKTLKIKHKNLHINEINNYIENFKEFVKSFGKNGLYQFNDILLDIIFSKAQDFIRNNFLKNVSQLDDFEKEIINYIFNRISLSLDANESWAFMEYGFNAEKYVHKVNTEQWANEFNQIFNTDLETIKAFVNKYKHGGGILGPNYREQIVFFWDFYDILLKLGLGYYVPWITTAGKLFMHFKIFDFLYKEKENFFSFITKIPELKSKISRAQNTLEKEKLDEKWQDDSVECFNTIKRSSSRYIPPARRRAVFERDGGKCVNAGKIPDCLIDQELHIDHIIPVKKGGGNNIANLQLLCRVCNLKKSDKIE